MYYPDQNDFINRAQDRSGNLLLVHTELHKDALTPIMVFKVLQDCYDNAFLLESVEHGESVGRYTFVGVDSMALIRFQKGVLTISQHTQEIIKETCQDPFPLIQDYMKNFRPLPHEGMSPFVGGAVGYFTYDVVRVAEDIPATGTDDLKIPDIFLMVTERVLIFDHTRQKIYVVASAFLNEDRSVENLEKIYTQTTAKMKTFIEDHLQNIPAENRSLQKEEEIVMSPEKLETLSNMSKKDFLKTVQVCKEYIQAGDILQVVVSQRFAVPLKTEPLEVYRTLRVLNPSPYMFYLKCGDFVLTGSSPETMVKLQDGVVETKPIAGARRRGQTPEEDDALADELLKDPKECAEHLMLVDLGRNDIGKLAKKETVKVSKLMEVERYSHVMHIVSKVQGQLGEDKDAFDAILATFPAGTLSGAPKIRAMEIIDELEPTLRGSYGGLCGYIGFDGNMDTAITIRSMLCKDDIAYVQAGGGIVADSDPESEYQESLNKAMAVLMAIQMTQNS
jgi:anthranilate synthase component 1